MAWLQRTRSARDTYEPLLGTRVQIQLEATGRRQLDQARRVAVGEIERLEKVFSIYDEQSEISRWGRGELAEPGAELAAVLSLSKVMVGVTGGAFAPGAERLVSRWRQAERENVEPSPQELAALVEAIQAEPLAPPGLSLNAIAKGYIVDACAGLVGSMRGVRAVTVNAGGDILRHGSSPIVVGIEDPRTPFDNAEPLDRVELDGCALATSGTERRGFLVGGTRYGHVIDPRSGWPVSHVLSASVVAPSAAVADALATALMVLDPAESCQLAESLPGVAMVVIGSDATVTATDRWGRIQR